MSVCNVEVVKNIGKYLNSPVGSVCFSTDKVLTTVLDKENVEGFASIVLRLASKSGSKMSQEQTLLSYQWLEHIAMYADQAAANPVFAKSFLQDINKALEKNTYLTGQFFTITDVAAYHVLIYADQIGDILKMSNVKILGTNGRVFVSRITNVEEYKEVCQDLIGWKFVVSAYPSVRQECLSLVEKEALLHVCRWSKHIQAQPKVCGSRPPLPVNMLTLSILAPAAH